MLALPAASATLPARISPCGVASRNSPPSLRDGLDPMARQVGHAARIDRGVQGAEQAQRIHVAVERAVAAADDLGPDVGQHLRDLARGRGSRSCSRRCPAGCAGACRLLARASSSFSDRQRWKPPGRWKRDVEAGLLLQQIGEAAPGVGRADRPAGVGRAGPAPCSAPRPARSCRARRAPRDRPRRARRPGSPRAPGPRRSRRRPAPPPTTATSYVVSGHGRVRPTSRRSSP